MPNDNTNPETNSENSTNPENNPETNPEAGKTNPLKTFTQEDVNRLTANEKRQGRQSVLKELGLDVNDKDAIKKAKALLDAQRTDAEKNATDLKNLQSEHSEALARAEAAERKLAAMQAGCLADYVNEVIALAALKVTDTVTFEKAIEQVKEKCPTFFGEEGQHDSGTGNGQGHRRQNAGNEKGALGARLAKQAVSANSSKNPYFNN